MTRLTNIIVAIDDDACVSSIEVMLATQKGYRALVARDPERMLEMLQKHNFDCIIATEAFQGLRADPLVRLIRSGAICAPGLPIVILTVGNSHARTALSSADYFVVEHSINDIDRIVSVIETAIASRPKPRMIVIDDNKDCLDDLTNYLGRAFEIAPALNVQEGLRLFRQSPPDIIITDLSMPIEDGGDLTRAIREIDQSVPILMLTMYDTPENHVKTVVSGISRFLSKKAPMKEIEQACRELLLQRELDEARSDIEGHRDEATRLVTAIANARAEIASGDASIADHRLKAIVAKLAPAINDDL